MYKKILIPLDNSPTDNAILTHIKSLGALAGSRVVLVHVADGFAARWQNQLNLADSEEIRKDKDYLQQKEAELSKEGFQVTTFLAQGEPADEILAIVEQEQCDLIAMSTHGHRFLKDFFLGSVAENIRHRTAVPILMIRASAK